MMLFLRLADADAQMTAREMERFDELLAAPQWAKSPLLQRAIANTRLQQPDLWKRYAAGTFRPTAAEIAIALDAVLCSLPPDERREVERDLTYFCSELHRTA